MSGLAVLLLAPWFAVLGLAYDPAGHHPIIREIVASLVAYKGFLLVLAAAWFWRRRSAVASHAKATAS